MKVIALFAALATPFVVTMTHAQTPPNSTVAVKAKAQVKAVTAGSHPSVTQSLDALVRHLQNKGFVVSHVQKDFNPDGTLKYYSAHFSNKPQRDGFPASSGHASVKVGVVSDAGASTKENLLTLPVQDRFHAAKPVSAKQLTQSLMVLNAEAFDGGRLDYIRHMGKSRHFTSAQVSEMLATFSFDDDRGMPPSRCIHRS